MKAIGGFLPLETGQGATSCHPRAAALASGRACWHVILRTCRPRRVWLPFYICDAMLQPLAATNTPYEFYALTEEFRPEPRCAPASDELMLVVNYFGALSAAVDRVGFGDRDRVVIDDTQAFFRCGSSEAWSFNSARKFFGVPDGGYLYGPASGLSALPPSESADCDHLLARLAGDDVRAWELFKQHEARIGIEPRAMSAVASRLLGGVDLGHARRSRQVNFETLHRRLGPRNTIGIPLDEVASAGPMCYPFLPAAAVERAALSRRGVFVPTLWPEIDARPGGFDRERDVARRLLALPIDHRYEPGDMETVADTLQQVLQ
jgi:hypothetical protein